MSKNKEFLKCVQITLDILKDEFKSFVFGGSHISVVKPSDREWIFEIDFFCQANKIIIISIFFFDSYHHSLHDFIVLHFEYRIIFRIVKHFNSFTFTSFSERESNDEVAAGK